jgi:hypothetical protein
MNTYIVKKKGSETEWHFENMIPSNHEGHSFTGDDYTVKMNNTETGTTGIYIGSLSNGQLSGRGKIKWTDASGNETANYEGEWVGNAMHGNGTLERPGSASRYRGGFSHGKRHGLGEFWQSADELKKYELKYAGDYSEDLKHGFGVFYTGDSFFSSGRWGLFSFDKDAKSSKEITGVKKVDEARRLVKGFGSDAHPALHYVLAEALKSLSKPSGQELLEAFQEFALAHIGGIACNDDLRRGLIAGGRMIEDITEGDLDRVDRVLHAASAQWRRESLESSFSVIVTAIEEARVELEKIAPSLSTQTPPPVSERGIEMPSREDRDDASASNAPSSDGLSSSSSRQEPTPQLQPRRDEATLGVVGDHDLLPSTAPGATSAASTKQLQQRIPPPGKSKYE